MNLKQKERKFQLKELTVWQRSVDFADKVIGLAENLDTNSRHVRLIEQLESEVASISHSISEGKGRRSKNESVQFLYIS